MFSPYDNLRAFALKQLVGAGTRTVFSQRLPRPLMRSLLDALAMAIPPAAGVNLEEGRLGQVPCDFWTPQNFQPGRLLLYCHGGGYTLFSRKTHRVLVSRLAQEFAAQAVAFDYRLAPEHRFPAAVEDALSVYRELLARGFAPEKMVFAGDSAGGGLTFALLLAAKDAKLPLPALAVGISPWLDLTLSGYSHVENRDKDPMLVPENTQKLRDDYLGDADARNPYASPLFGNLAGLPPVMLQAAGDETLRDDSVLFAAALRQAGVIVELDICPGLFHDFQIFWQVLPEAEAAIRRMGQFVRQHWGN
ncbi:MAG: alpha/beta hydrolase [Turneriella sp.]|nr:alpha/beta hydrolase [Turneriella sp.]